MVVMETISRQLVWTPIQKKKNKETEGYLSVSFIDEM
jgi:hypothetical protein